MAHRRWLLAGSIPWLPTGFAYGIGRLAGGEGDVVRARGDGPRA